MFERVLIANRGEIACRVIRTLREMGIRSVAVYSDADRGAKHVALADEAVRIGPAPAHESYLDADAIIAAARASGAQAIHPGYGFLSENAELARACDAAGLAFVGPRVHALEVMADKIRAKQHVSKAGVPVIAGVSSRGLTDRQLEAAAIELGFPILVKPSAGGGGKGMVPVHAAAELNESLATARRVAASAFGDDTLLLERLVTAPRHIEVQLLADTHGNVIHLGERECSLQRRHQKVIEEAPSPLLSAETRERIGEAACTVARSVDYVGVGTVEFLVSADAPDEFFFMEMNTRLQVEHPVTELVAGIDLVAWQLRVAAGEALSMGQQDVRLTGHAVEARIYAENPEAGFIPSTGTVLALREPSGEAIRVDSSLIDGLVVSPHYDPMLAKIIAWGADRSEALARLDGALAATCILGVHTNLEYLRALIADPDVRAGALDTTLIERRLPTLEFRRPDAAMLIAAALYLHSRPRSPSAWQANAGWRISGSPRPHRYLFSPVPGERVSVHLSEGVAEVDGTSHEARIHTSGSAAAPNGQVTIEVDGVSSSWMIARDADTIWLGQSGFSWPLEVIDRATETTERVARIARADRPILPEIRSPMPGTVVAVSTQDGTRVAAGDTVVTVEAMKMEHRLAAPVSGIVTIAARSGDLVRLDQVLATITQEEP